MIHYEDAASFVVAALNASVKRMVLMAVDDKTVTKKEICEAALSSGLFPGAKMPQFRTDSGPLGKRCDGSFSKAYLQWKPAFPSFDVFMSSPPAAESSPFTLQT
eukprot:gene5032-3593_t